MRAAIALRAACAALRGPSMPRLAALRAACAALRGPSKPGLAVIAICAVAVAATPAFADDARAGFRLADNAQPHVGIPFQLDLVVEGFDETPAPEMPKLSIPD